MLIERCPWYVAGPLIGLCIVALRAMVNRPFGALGGYIDLVSGGWHPRQWSLAVFTLLGIVAGGVLFAVVSPSSSPSLTQPSAAWAATWPLQLAGLLGAGILMGFGARRAGGCTSGHGLTGMSLGSPASLAAAATFFATALALAQLWAWLIGVQS
jgi:uncharacterized membrane protein YedE/YeeE